MFEKIFEATQKVISIVYDILIIIGVIAVLMLLVYRILYN